MSFCMRFDCGFRRVSAAMMAAIVLGAATVGCAPAQPKPKPTEVVDDGPGYPYLRLSLAERRVYLIEAEGKPPESFLVAIGRKPWETPVGKFRINQMVKDPDWVVVDFNNPDKPSRLRVPPGPNNPMGLRWISFASAHGWEVGFHGTSKEQLLGQAVSHGCVRMKNSDVVKVYDKVKLGTTVIVEP
jgi:lipoprotein-anchoring transpeptidase ErfK/SrfK